MVELIERNEPAIMLCHWPGLYSQGTKQGFHDFQKVVTALQGRFSDQTYWMKLSDIGRYWAARELTKVAPRDDGTILFDAPLACTDFTVRMGRRAMNSPMLHAGDSNHRLREVNSAARLIGGTYWKDDEQVIACFNLPKGESRLVT
jgi:hypothetical protein